MADDSSKEVSLSVEETNKLRAKLGLKPLVIDRPSTSASAASGSSTGAGDRRPGRKTAEEEQREAEERYARVREEEALAAEQRAIQERIEAARRRRLLNQQLAGKGLGEASDDDEDDSASAAAWVAKSRARAEQRRRQLEEQQRRQLEEEAAAQESAYDASELADLQVAHDVGELVDRKEKPVVLTLKDDDVLADGADVLEDVAETSRLRREELIARRTGRKRTAMYDDEEFEDPTAIGPNAKRRKVNLLSKYDDVIEEQDKQAGGDKPSTKRLGDAVAPAKVSVSVPPPAPTGAAGRYAHVSLADPGSGMQLQSEYLSGDEAAVFKPKKKRRKKKRDVNDGTGAKHRRAPAADVADQIPATSVSAPAAVTSVDESAERFLARIGRASADARAGTGAGADSGGGNGEVGEDAVLQAVEQVVAAEEAEAVPPMLAGGIQFTETTEFARMVGTEDGDDDNAYAGSRDGRDDEAMPDAPVASTASPVGRSAGADADAGTGNESAAAGDEAALTAAHQQIEAALVPSTVASSGVSATLARLRSQGMLREEMAGRTMDQRHQLALERANEAALQRAREHEDPSMQAPVVHVVKPAAGARHSHHHHHHHHRENDEEPEINPIVYEHRDEHGRLLTAKEVFRRQSWAFHGKKPGKKKMEKILAREDEARERARRAQMDVTADVMRRLDETTRLNHQSFVVLEGRKLLEKDVTPLAEQEISKKNKQAASRALVPRQARRRPPGAS